MKKEWQILQPYIYLVEKLCGMLNCHPAVASILINRNIYSTDRIFIPIHFHSGRIRLYESGGIFNGPNYAKIRT